MKHSTYCRWTLGLLFLSPLATVSAAFRVDAKASMRSLSVLSSKFTPAPYGHAFCPAICSSWSLQEPEFRIGSLSMTRSGTVGF